MFSESRAASVSGIRRNALRGAAGGALFFLSPVPRFCYNPPCSRDRRPPASARADKRTFRKREDVDSGNVGTFLTVRLFGFAREIVRDPLSVHPRLPTASRKTETPGRAPSFRHPLRKAESHERVKTTLLAASAAVLALLAGGCASDLGRVDASVRDKRSDSLVSPEPFDSTSNQPKSPSYEPDNDSNTTEIDNASQAEVSSFAISKLTVK